MVHLDGLCAIVVGAGDVAAAKAQGLLDAGADVVVVAPDAVAAIRRLADDGRLAWHPRAYREDDLDPAVLVITATGVSAVDERVAADAARRSRLCVRADGGGTAAFVGVVRRGPLSIAVSTDGAAPALAKRLRDQIAATYGPEYGELAELLGRLRRDPAVESMLSGLDSAQRAARWRSVLDVDILSLIRTGRIDLAREVALSCLSSSSG